MKVGNRYSSAPHSPAQSRKSRSSLRSIASATPESTAWPFSCQPIPSSFFRSRAIRLHREEVPIDCVDGSEDSGLELLHIDRAPAVFFDEEDKIGNPDRFYDALFNDCSVIGELFGPDFSGLPDNPLSQLLSNFRFSHHGTGSSVRIPCLSSVVSHGRETCSWRLRHEGELSA